MMMSETMRFKIFCIEEYRRKHGMTAPETIALFEKFGVFGFLEQPALRWQFLENTVMDIDEYIETRLKRDGRNRHRGYDGKVRNHQACPRTLTY